jgi:malonate transporter and related proteins
MFASTVSVLIPVLFVVLLGYAAGRARNFDSDQVAGINELVLDFALPASLFVGIVGISRTELSSSLSFLLVVLAALVITYAIAFVIGRLLLHLVPGAAALFALSASFPAAPFFGPAVLGGLFGPTSALSISSVAIIANLVLVPISLVVLEASGSSQPPRAVIGRAIANSARQPFVWMPVLAFLLVLSGINVPDIVKSMLNLIGETTSGLALFVAGLLLAAHSFRLNVAVTVGTGLKSLGQPALMLGLALLVGLHNPLASQGVVAMALSSAVIATMLAPRYKLFQSEAASTMLASSILMLIVLPACMWITASVTP